MTRAARERRFRRIKELGCLACREFGYWAPPEIHHLNEGGHAGQRRRGDEYTIGLCRFHHRGVGKPPCNIGPSMAKEPRHFREYFGSDDQLLDKQNALIANAEKNVVGRIIDGSR